MALPSSYHRTSSSYSVSFPESNQLPSQRRREAAETTSELLRLVRFLFLTKAGDLRDMAAEQQQQPASRFAVTCGLLRQYMKEQGGNGARCLAPAVGLVPPAADAAAAEERATVLELFPQQAGTLKDEQQQRKRKEPAAERAPLTIFYGGKMVVFDDFPAEKAEELMKLAGSGDAAGQNALGQATSLTDMPIARKASLKRFLEKRKNRLTAGDPYPAAIESSSKPVKEEGAPWLGVSSALSLS